MAARGVAQRHPSPLWLFRSILTSLPPDCSKRYSAVCRRLKASRGNRENGGRRENVEQRDNVGHRVSRDHPVLPWPMQTSWR
jgi:hypothetical protein